MPGSLSRATALTAVPIVLISGCSSTTNSTVVVSAKELQKSLVEHLAQAGTPSTWVVCEKDLPGRVGAVSRCDVNFRTDNTVTAVLTTTQVDGDRIDWEVTGPELTEEQTTQRVAGLTSAQSATCDSGLDGRPGDWVQCQTTKDGVVIDQTVEVKGAQGLSLDLALTPAMSQRQTEKLLLSRLAARHGSAFESATCPGNLVGEKGTTMDCVVSSQGREGTYTLVVTDIRNGSMNFDVVEPDALVEATVVPAPLAGPSAPAPLAAPSAPAPLAGPVVPAPVPSVAPAPAPVFIPQPEPVQMAPEPAPVMAVPDLVPEAAPEPVPEIVPEPAPVDAVPHLPLVVPHLPSGAAVPAPGPVAIEAGAGQVVNQASAG